MIKKFDNSRKMMEDIFFIDSKSFNDIDCNIDELCERIKKNNKYELFIKYKDEKPIAYIGILYVANLHYDGAWIDLIGVIEEFRNVGIGSELVKYAEKIVREQGKKIITGLIRKNNISSINMIRHSNFKNDDVEFLLFSKTL
ncbi:GNAT family N-acetyltransferase [Fusobacterium sp. SYSU M8D902]|uniref:GNAT family N-acetyltransferase n=1 Tax=Fusobacterium sp. SYSU M8D902 TaxID=3159562 RepID=UPI0032E50191